MWQFMGWILLSALLFVCATITSFRTKDAWDKWHKPKDIHIINVHQNSSGNNNQQLSTTGNNSPIIGQLTVTPENSIDLDYEVDSITRVDDGYQRSAKIRNNSKTPAYNVHFSIKSDSSIINDPVPWPEGGGAIQVNYRRIDGNVYEAEVGIIPPRKYIKVVIQSEAQFEIEKVTIY